MSLLKVPQHLAVIMDGNGRWAKSKGEERVFGHKKGIESVRSIIKGCRRLGISYLTLYTFSTENWNRPKEEVDALMNLLASAVQSEKEELIQNDICLKLIGNIDELPEFCRTNLQDVVQATASNSKLTVILALSYSSRWELTTMVQHIAQKVKNGTLEVEHITNEVVEQHLTTAGIPDPDLLIRTGGEARVSNFLLWQLAYTEFYFTPIFWPDFNEDELEKALEDYTSRERRFGKISEQL